MATTQPPYQLTETLYRNNKTGEVVTEATDPDVSYTQLGRAGQTMPFASAVAYGIIGPDGAAKSRAKGKAMKAPPSTKAVSMPPATKQGTGEPQAGSQSGAEEKENAGK